MTNISFDDEQVKGMSKDEFAQHFADNNYDWSDTDIEGYWNKLNPALPYATGTNDKQPKRSQKPNNTGGGGSNDGA